MPSYYPAVKQPSFNLAQQISPKRLQITMADFREDEFPVPTRQATGTVNGVKTDVTSLSFSDKLLVTISQQGRLSQWVTFHLLEPTASRS